ncbi:glycosyltransferase family 2 protein [Flavobacterium sp.]|uniref:glycosyltransferase family 2 protein n=1 Tax=Flavobacterium sp. TaxID=239 RepID=UPI003753A2D1
MILISVIIPVYNAQQYLADCIKSLLAQTLTRCEFIFVNDGSTDQSKEIIESFQAQDNRISIVNQENKGVSSARNAGIEKAIGAYLSFIDADDYINKNFLNYLYTMVDISKVNIVVSNMSIDKNEIITKNESIFRIDKIYLYKEIQTIILPYFLEKDLLNTACTNLYNTSFIKSNDIKFPVNVINGEDGLFNIQAFNKVKSVLFLDYNGYFYREVANSATRNSIKIDYFKIALEKFNINYKKEFNVNVNETEVLEYKSIRLINTVVSLIPIYFNSKKSFIFKYKYIASMIGNNNVQLAIKNYWEILYSSENKYNKYLLKCIKNKSVLLLFLAISYSNYKNK